jgi:exodeoxyribonuclease-1
VNTYLFYDIETTGLNRVFDQVLQFAGIRTTTDLVEIERHNIRVRLRPDVIPSPRALLTHRIPFDTLLSGECEFEATGRIHALLNHPGTISLGYNSLGFDDEFLRFAFYRNLLPPYTHQYDQGCGRMDLLPMTAIFWLYHREVLNWPEVKGVASLKLEKLNAANRLTGGKSHDAMADVEACLTLARRFRRVGDMWTYLCGCFDKQTDRQRMKSLPVVFDGPAGAHRLGILVDSQFGSERNYQAPVIGLGDSIPYANQSLWLRLDQAELSTTREDTIAENTWVIRKKAGEPGIILPPRERFWKRLPPESTELAAKNQEWLGRETALFERIIAYHRAYRYPRVPHIDPDGALYDNGFPSPGDRRLCRRFQSVSLEERQEIARRFSDPCLGTLARRVLFRNYPDRLNGELRREFEAYMRTINPDRAEQAAVDYRGRRRRTPVETLLEIRQLSEEQHDAEALGLLRELRAYIEDIFGGDGRGESVGKG